MLSTSSANKPNDRKRTRPARRPDLVRTIKTPGWKHERAELRFHSTYTRVGGPIAESPCWEWDGTLCRDGHGRFAHSGKRSVTAHRYAIEVVGGFGPLGSRRVRHMCGNKACVNPTHFSCNRGPDRWPEGAIAPRVGDYSLTPSDVARFQRSVGNDPLITCQLWQGAPHKRTGCAQVRMGDKYVGVHRVAYAIAHGSIPEGLSICHGPTCEALGLRGRLCCNPDHLIADTPAANMADKNGGHWRRALSDIPISPSARVLTEQFLPHAIEVLKEQGHLIREASIEEMQAMDLASENTRPAPMLPPNSPTHT